MTTDQVHRQAAQPKPESSKEVQATTSHTDPQSPKPTNALVLADLLIPGRGSPIKNAALVYTIGGPILWVGPSSSLRPRYLFLPTTRVPYLLPGLWDCHVHLTGSSTLNLDSVMLTDKAYAGARIARDLAAMLNAGYTSCRELGGFGWSVAKAVDEGWLPGPHIYSSVSMLSQTGGHGDANTLPVELVRERQRDGYPFHLCDGVDECVKAVREKIRQGARLIKVAASGGVLSYLDDPHSLQFSVEELEAMVREAAKTGRIVAAHCHGKEAIMAALKAGCRTIEHGTFMDDECIELMKETGAILIGTQTVVNFGISHPELVPPEIYKKILAVAETAKAAYAKAVKAGVKCALGTDLLASDLEHGFYHGVNGRELVFAVEAGMSELQAIRAATATAPETMGEKSGVKSGVLEEGYDADFIAVLENPLEDIEVLASPAKVSHVWKGGYLYKKPGKPVGFFPMVAEIGD